MHWPPLSEVLDALADLGLPALAAAGVQVLFLILGGRRARLRASRLAGVGSAAALAAGFAAGNWHSGALPWLPGGYADSWLPWVGLAALLAGAVAGAGPRSRAAMWLVAVAFAFLWRLVPPEVLAEAWWWAPVLALVVACSWVLADEQARRHPGASVPVWLALTLLAAAIILIHAGSRRYMAAALYPAGALLGIAVAGSWWSAETGPVAGVASIFLAGLMLSGQTQTVSEVPWSAFLLVALAPLTLAVSLIPPLAGMKTWTRLLLQTGLLLAPLAAAVVLAMRHAPLDFSFSG